MPRGIPNAKPPVEESPIEMEAIGHTPAVTDANSKAAAVPAPIPTKAIGIVTSCPAPHRAVRDGMAPPQPSATGLKPAASLMCYCIT